MKCESLKVQIISNNKSILMLYDLKLFLVSKDSVVSFLSFLESYSSLKSSKLQIR